ncbi:MAG TPA: hypothetical protein VFJ47_12285, partial [Terriglobales bacterium]|nr:hypothetical protein [Terriglobales bacterium]
MPGGGLERAGKSVPLADRSVGSRTRAGGRRAARGERVGRGRKIAEPLTKRRNGPGYGILFREHSESPCSTCAQA